MNKKILVAILAISAILSTSAVVTAEAPIKVKVGGELLETDVAPVAIDGRVMLPVRAVFEAIDAKVSYIADEQKVVATKKDKTVTFVIGSKTMTINGEAKEIDVPATVINNRTLVPVRACSEAFDLKVEWNGSTSMVKVKKPVSLLVEEKTTDYNGEYVYSYEYDENGNLLSKKNSTNGEVITYQYDEYDNMIYEEKSDGTWKKYEYDEEGKCVREEDSQGEWKRYGHDKNGNLIYEGDMRTWWRTYEYDEKGNMISEGGSDGRFKEYKYDENGRLIHMRADDANVFDDEYWYKYTYDENGNLIQEESGSYAWGNSGISRKYTYDESGKLIHAQIYGDQIKYEYDENGNLIYEESSDGDYKKYIVMEV